MDPFNPFQVSTLLAREGRFGKALSTLNNSRTRRPLLETQVLRAELLEKMGAPNECTLLLQEISRSAKLTDSLQSACELVRSRLAHSRADPEAAIRHVRKSIALANKASDLTRLCKAQLRLLVMLADRSGPESVSSLLFESRRNIAKLGDPRITAALHLTVGELEGRRGLLDRSEHHARIVSSLLKDATDLWCEAWMENHFLGLCCLRHEFDEGLAHGHKALALSEESGAVSLRVATLGNLGNLYRTSGQFGNAIECLERAISYSASGEHLRAITESIADIRLSQGFLAECDRLLTSIEGSVGDAPSEAAYVDRHARLTRTRWFVAQKQWPQALETANAVTRLASAVEDGPLLAKARITLAEVLSRLGNFEQALATLSGTVLSLPLHTPDIHAEYETVLAVLQQEKGEASDSLQHFGRAHRILCALRANPDLVQLTEGLTNPAVNKPAIGETKRGSEASGLLQDVVAALMHVDRPTLLASDLLAILSSSSSVKAADAHIARSDGSRKILEHYGDKTHEPGPSKTVSLVSSESGSIGIRYWPRPDGESIATLGAFELFVQSLHTLRQARVEREERMTLWPVEHPTIDGTHAVVNGAFRDLLKQAQHVAKTNVTVLIAGESGTGKEILARAVHQYSERADKPFVPFNCAAVPRDLLESQLFGYRRGAFTGADRDSQGLIRAASEGTLFLDEIGELSLDLQPKLLRFLESGEIAPLGETSPVRVDVRIVAATNTSLEQLVQEKRFRDDLFYRLHVISLPIPPLRQRRDEIPELVRHFTADAAREYGKRNVSVAEETMERLLLYKWPGNIRQLQNELRAMVALAEPDSVLKPSALSPDIRRVTPRGLKGASHSHSEAELNIQLSDKLAPTIARVEREMIQNALRTHPGQLDAAARSLGISRKGLYLKRQRLGI